ncbi:hypothetical protein ACLK19_22965 [Escherichia coli]
MLHKALDGLEHQVSTFWLVRRLTTAKRHFLVNLIAHAICNWRLFSRFIFRRLAGVTQGQQ